MLITVFKKNLYGFCVFYKVFPKNRIKVFLKIIINYNFQNIYSVFPYFERFFFFKKTVQKDCWM